MTTSALPTPFSWTRVSKERMTSGAYTAFKCSGDWVLWFGVSDQQHRAKTIGRFHDADAAYAAAEKHSHS